jgi:hypothetical protein
MRLTVDGQQPLLRDIPLRCAPAQPVVHCVPDSAQRGGVNAFFLLFTFPFFLLPTLTPPLKNNQEICIRKIIMFNGLDGV